MSAVNAILHALLDDGSAEQIEAEVVAWVDQVNTLPDPERVDALADLDLILGLRGLIERLRRRSRELRALFETAGDLSSTRDVEGVLHAIVKRGRQLLDTDVAYLMLVDEQQGDTFMRVTEGTTSRDFVNIRLPLGAGLGGRVAETRAPMWTRNYRADQGYVHVIDDVVVDEQLVAILGVPLRVGSKLLGTLFAADRAERDFTNDEVSLLASLADHAAIAIENAAMFQATQEAVTALSSANSVIERSNYRLRRAVDLHERFMELVAAGGELDEIVHVLRDVLQGAVVIWDHYGIEAARAESPIDGATGAAQLLADAAPVDSEEMVELAVGGDRALVAPIIAAGDRLGTVAFLGATIGDDDARALERGTSVVAVLLLNRRARDEADNRVRGEILAELLLQAPGSPDAIRRRAGLLGVDLAQEQSVLVLVPPTGTVTRALQLEVSDLIRGLGGLSAAYADRIVALVPASWHPRPAEEMAARLRRRQVTVGGAGPTADLGALIPLEDRARRSALLLRSLGRLGEGVASDELGIYGLLLSAAGQSQTRTFVEGCLGPVRAYDAERKTSLVPTMEAYFAADGSVADTAEAMYIHVNTVYQRLERLDQLLEPSWRTGDRALECRLALRFDNMMNGQF